MSSLPPNWKTATDQEGNVYYYNTVTRETSWSPPQPSIFSINEQRQPESLSPPNPKSPTIITKIVSILQPYFNVDTEDIVSRIKYSLVPNNSSFFQMIKENPDMYGPFWIYTTLVIVLAAASNFSLVVHQQMPNNLEFVTGACSLIYFIGFIGPLLIWGIISFMGAGLNYTQVLSLYGYSMAVYVPVAALCIAPFEMLRWALIIYATGASCVFLVMNLNSEIDQMLPANKKYVFLGVVGGVQLFIGLAFKLNFFDLVYDN